MYDPNQIMPVDHTGYGPSGGGFNPTAEELMTAERNRWHSTRAAQAMAFQDPYIQRGLAASARVMAANNSPDAVRRQIYGTAAGQIGQDLLMGARRAGYLGYGDPVNTSNNVMRGVTTGGFGVDLSERMSDGSVRATGFGQQVTGGGVLAERMAINYQGGLMRDLYGSGNTDPSKLYGFDMEQSSEVFASLARRGGLGSNSMHIQKNANLETRLGSARDQAVDPMIKAGLASLSGASLEQFITAEDSLKRGEGDERLNKFLETIQDPKVREELNAVARARDASVINEDARKEVAGAVKEVIKGLSSLKDIYGEMSTPQLQMQMQALTGVRITDKASARRANNMVDSLRGAAENSGFDPRAFMDALMINTADMQGKIMQRMGLTEKDRGAANSLKGAFTNEVAQQSMVDFNMAKENENRAKKMGYTNLEGSARDIESYQYDVKVGQDIFLVNYQEIAAIRGAIGAGLGGEKDLKRNKDISDRFAAAKTREERDLIVSEARNQIADAYGGGSYDQAMARYAGTMTNALGNNAAGMQDQNNADISRMRNQDQKTDGYKRVITEAGGSQQQADQVADVINRVTGGLGLTQLEEVSRSATASGAAKHKRQMDILTKEGKMSEDDAARFLGVIYDKDGKRIMSDTDHAALMGQASIASNDATTVMGGVRGANIALENSKRGGLRGKWADAGGDLTPRALLNAVMGDKEGKLSSDEGKTLLMQTLKDAGHNMTVDGVDYSKQFATGIDLSKGMTADALKQLNEVAGKDLGLASGMGYKSDAEMIEATQRDPEARAKMLQRLQGNKDLNITGGIDSMNVTTDKALSMVDSQGLVQRAKEFAVAKSILGPSMGDKEQDQFADGFGSGTQDTHLQADTYKDDGFTYWGTKKAYLNTAGRNYKIASEVNSASKEDLMTFGGSEAGSQTLKMLEDNLANLKQAKDNDVSEIHTFDAEGKPLVMQVSDQLIKANEEIIKKLQEAVDASKGAQTIGTMKVDKLEVTGNFNPTK